MAKTLIIQVAPSYRKKPDTEVATHDLELFGPFKVQEKDSLGGGGQSFSDPEQAMKMAQSKENKEEWEILDESTGLTFNIEDEKWTGAIYFRPCS